MSIVDFIEFCFMSGMFINAALFIPQIIRLVKYKESKDLSIITFGGFALIQFFTILHGYLAQDYMLMFGMSLSLVSCLTVNILIIYYRLKKHDR